MFLKGFTFPLWVAGLKAVNQSTNRSFPLWVAAGAAAAAGQVVGGVAESVPDARRALQHAHQSHDAHREDDVPRGEPALQGNLHRAPARPCRHERREVGTTFPKRKRKKNDTLYYPFM